MKESQELQDLVLGILAPEEEVPLERQELLNELREVSFSPQEALAFSRQTLNSLNEGGEKTALPLVSELAARINTVRTDASYYGRSSTPGYTLSLNLLDYLQDKISFTDLCAWIKKYSDELELRILTQNNDQRMAYLEKQWGEETSAQLAEILKTKKSTVQRWLEGGNPSSSNASRMDQIITVLFRLHARLGMSEEAALDWFNSHNARLGDSPRNVIRDSSYWGLDHALQEELKTLGAFE